jgi:flavin-dependent dehydrogenase
MYCGVAPLLTDGPDAANVALVVDQREFLRHHQSPEQFFAASLATFPGLTDRMREGEVVRPVLATGPMAQRSAPAPGGVFLVGDAAHFLDPFTGQGIGRAIRSGRLAARWARAHLEGMPGATYAFERECARAFRGERLVEQVIQGILARPGLFDRVTRRLDHRPDLAAILLGVTGDRLPPRRVLNPGFAARLALA